MVRRLKILILIYINIEINRLWWIMIVIFKDAFQFIFTSIFLLCQVHPFFKVLSNEQSLIYCNDITSVIIFFIIFVIVIILLQLLVVFVFALIIFTTNCQPYIAKQQIFSTFTFLIFMLIFFLLFTGKSGNSRTF